MLSAFRSIRSLLLAALATLPATAQRPPEHLAPLNQFTLGAEFSDDSSHIILGQSFNRRLAGLDLTWSRRVGRLNGIAYTWEVETRPVVVLQDPVATTTSSFLLNGVPVAQAPPTTAPVQSTCANATVSITAPVSQPGSGTGTFNYTRTCGTRWTYAGGLSPVGQRLNLFPRHPFQPYLLANGGFLVSTRDIPTNDSSRFNFTFTFGGGLQFFRADGTAWSFDYRVQHLSSKNIGDNNPGIDSQIVRLSYTVPSVHRRRSE